MMEAVWRLQRSPTIFFCSSVAALIQAFPMTAQVIPPAFTFRKSGYLSSAGTNVGSSVSAAQSFPFFAFRYGRGGCAKLKEICGAINGAVLFMSCFVEDFAEIPALAKKLADWAAETELPTFVPADDKYPDFLKVKAGGITCAVMGKAWMSAATDEQKKIVGERCKRHTASIMGKAVEILNEFYAG